MKQLILDGITALAIHGNKSQGARTRALAEFKTGDLAVLCATDIAARGIDIDQLPHVVNYDLPNIPEDYVHRIGRTGRAGSTGEAISLVCVDEHEFLRDIERLIKRDIPQEVIPGFEPDRNEKAQPILQRQGRGQNQGQQRGQQRGQQPGQQRSGGGQGQPRGKSGGGGRSQGHGAQKAPHSQPKHPSHAQPKPQHGRPSSQPAPAHHAKPAPAAKSGGHAPAAPAGAAKKKSSFVYRTGGRFR